MEVIKVPDDRLEEIKSKKIEHWQASDYADVSRAITELKLYRLQHRKRDLMIRKAQLLKQNKTLLEKQKEGKK